MSATYCLGPFAQRLRTLPWAQWRDEIAKLPEACPKGCAVNCRAVCTSYARVQWRASKALQATNEHKAMQKGAKR